MRKFAHNYMSFTKTHLYVNQKKYSCFSVLQKQIGNLRGKNKNQRNNFLSYSPEMDMGHFFSTQRNPLALRPDPSHFLILGPTHRCSSDTNYQMYIISQEADITATQHEFVFSSHSYLAGHWRKQLLHVWSYRYTRYTSKCLHCIILFLV